jgi:hypothetical protein
MAFMNLKNTCMLSIFKMLIDSLIHKYVTQIMNVK